MALEVHFVWRRTIHTSSFHYPAMQNKKFNYSNEKSMDVPFIRTHTLNIFASAGLSKMFYLKEESGKCVLV